MNHWRLLPSPPPQEEDTVDLEGLKRLRAEAWNTFDGGSKFVNALIHAFPAIVAALEKETKMNTNTLHPDYAEIAERFLLAWDEGRYDRIPASVFIPELVEKCQAKALSERREMKAKLEAAQTEREQLNEQLRKMGADWLATAINGMAESLPAARIRSLVEQHGSYRKVGELLGVDHAYLHRIASGEKDNMSDELLRKIGLRRGTFYAAFDKETVESRSINENSLLRGPVKVDVSALAPATRPNKSPGIA